jgi:hypothetical protein
VPGSQPITSKDARRIVFKSFADSYQSLAADTVKLGANRLNGSAVRGILIPSPKPFLDSQRCLLTRPKDAQIKIA